MDRYPVGYPSQRLQPDAEATSLIGIVFLGSDVGQHHSGDMLECNGGALVHQQHLSAAWAVAEEEANLGGTLVVRVLDNLDHAVEWLNIGTLGAARGAF